MVMEFVRGVNLELFIEQHRKIGKAIPIDLAAFIVSRVARGLTYAQKCDREAVISIRPPRHRPRTCARVRRRREAHGLRHREGPGPMYNEEGRGCGQGRLPFPEQASYAITDARADLFPLGIVLTELLLGRNIFRSADRAQSRRNILTLPFRNSPSCEPTSTPSLRRLSNALVRDRKR